MAENIDPHFKALFTNAYKMHFGHDFSSALSESEAKDFCIGIQEKTGLIIGYRSMKNYSIYLLENDSSKKENPSLATLDTLARYVLNAPATSDSSRKKNADHYPYWYRYQRSQTSSKTRNSYRKLLFLLIPFIALILALFLLEENKTLAFEDDFNAVDDLLTSGSWELINRENEFWNQRNAKPGLLQLFTLEGDNWPDTVSSQGIRNVLLRPVRSDCFSLEVQFQSFFPKERWQQAGLLILEDSLFQGRALRLSLAFNDYFGGFEYPAEVLVQGITLQPGKNPEEIVHHQVFQLNETSLPIIQSNLSFSGLRIEKYGDDFRFLLSNGIASNAAFKEVGRHQFSIEPKYVGIFALKGNLPSSEIIPVHFDRFNYQPFDCNE